MAAARGQNGADVKPLMERLSAEIGEEAALRLSAAYGGRQLYIAHTARADSELVRLVGEIAAAKLARRFGGVFLTLPMGPGRKMRIRQLRTEGYAVAEIAEALGCTERYAYRVLAQERAEGGPEQEAVSARARRRRRKKARKRGRKQKPVQAPPRVAEQRSLWE